MDRFGRMILVFALVGAVALAGCGSDSGSGETSKEKDVFYPWVKGPSREFLVRGGDNLIQYFGREATPADREAASLVIHKWMRARAAEDWAADCKYFQKGYRRSLIADAKRVTDGKVTTCPGALNFFGESASGDLENSLTGPIDSLRVKNTQGYAQWHGKKGIDWILSLRKEDGRWTITVAAPLYRNK